MITGTPIAVDRTDNSITVIFTTEDRPSSFTVECADDESASFCHDLWSDLVAHAEMLHEDPEVEAHEARRDAAEA